MQTRIQSIAATRTIAALLLASAVFMLPACKDHNAPTARPAAGSHDDHDDHDHGDHRHDDHAGHDHDDHHGHDEHGHDEHAAGKSKTSGGHTETITMQPDAMETWRITTQQAQAQQLVQRTQVPARVSFDLQAIAHAGTLASGRVTRIDATTGDVVRKDQPLLQIVSLHYGQLQSQWLQQHAAIAPAEASLEIARARYQSARKLYDENQSIALQQVQQLQAAVITLEQELAAANALLEATANELRLLGMDEAALRKLEETGKVDPAIVITSPQDGQVIHRNVAMGESISPEHDALFVIADLAQLWVLADVPQTLASQVQVGGSVTIHTSRNDANDASIEATIDYLSPQIDPQTRTRQARIIVPRQDDTLLPGMFVRVTLQLTSSDQQQIAIPAQAVQTVEDKPSVFIPVQGQRGQFTIRPIKTGPRVGDLIPILQGLSEGETYVSQGSFMLKAEHGKAGAGHAH